METNINCKQLPFIMITRRDIPFSSFEVSSRATDFYQYFSIDLCFWLCCRLLTVERFTLLSNNSIYGGEHIVVLLSIYLFSDRDFEKGPDKSHPILPNKKGRWNIYYLNWELRLFQFFRGASNTYANIITFFLYRLS